MDLRILIVLAPITVAVSITLAWLLIWKVIEINNFTPRLNNSLVELNQLWGEGKIAGADGVVTEEPKRSYAVFTVRWLTVNVIGIPSVFFLGAIAAMQFIRRV